MPSGAEGSDKTWEAACVSSRGVQNAFACRDLWHYCSLLLSACSTLKAFCRQIIQVWWGTRGEAARSGQQALPLCCTPLMCSRSLTPPDHLHTAVAWNNQLCPWRLRVQSYPTFHCWCSHANGASCGVEGQSQRPPQGMGTFVLLPWDCIVAAPVLDNWIGLGTKSPHNRNAERGQDLLVCSRCSHAFFVTPT